MVEIYIGSGIIALIFLIFQMIVLATEILIGNTAEDLDNLLEVTWTLIDFNNDANETGTITTVKIWANKNLAGCKVATFYRPDPIGSPNNWTTRDSETVDNSNGAGVVIAGSEQIFTVDLDVEAEDYIGMYYTGGGVDWNGVLGVGLYYKTGDNIPCDNVAFSFLPGDIFSLGGTGTTEVAVKKKNVIFMGSNF